MFTDWRQKHLWEGQEPSGLGSMAHAQWNSLRQPQDTYAVVDWHPYLWGNLDRTKLKYPPVLIQYTMDHVTTQTSIRTWKSFVGHNTHCTELMFKFEFIPYT